MAVEKWFVCLHLHVWLYKMLILISKPVEVHGCYCCRAAIHCLRLSMSKNSRSEEASLQWLVLRFWSVHDTAWFTFWHVRTLEISVVLLLLSPHPEAHVDPWEKYCLLSTGISICVALCARKALWFCWAQVSCQFSVLCSVPASLPPLPKDSRTDGLAVTLVAGQNFAV